MKKKCTTLCCEMSPVILFTALATVEYGSSLYSNHMAPLHKVLVRLKEQCLSNWEPLLVKVLVIITRSQDPDSMKCIQVRTSPLHLCGYDELESEGKRQTCEAVSTGSLPNSFKTMNMPDFNANIWQDYHGISANISLYLRFYFYPLHCAARR